MSLRIILLLLTVFVFHTSIQANGPFIFKNDNNDYIGEYVSTFKDNSRSLSIADVVRQKDKFLLQKQQVPNLGVDDANNWIRFALKNQTNVDKLYINLSQTNIDEVVFYTIREGVVDSVIHNSHNDFVFTHQFYLFDLPIKNGEEVEVYFKLHSNTQLLAPISIHTQKSLFSTLLYTDIFSAIYIGLMLSMLLYNAFLYFSTRESHYLSYVNYIFWVVVAQLAIMGLLGPMFAIENDWINSRLLVFSGAISGVAAILFVKSFLQSADNSPNFNLLLNLFILGYFFSIVLSCIGMIQPAYKMINVIAGGGSAIVLVLAFRLSRQKYKQTKLFLFAWCIFLISVIIYVFKDYNILPHNFFTLRSVQIGSFIEALLLSFALADKINHYRKEKEESQVQAMNMLLENERLIREQNVQLELKVKVRTRDLTMANESLSTTLQNLKDTQSQLVEAEKMASLGQLTAGIAHEINNPINFVTSNVAPLRRDIDIVWDAIHEFEQIALTESMSIEEKQQSLHKFKQEQDLDYIKMEMGFLLKGMHEGASRTAEIVKSLRLFSRVDEDTLKFADINEGVESTMVIANTLLKDKIKVFKKYGDIPAVECYAGKLNQVFLNIITNAIYAIDKKYVDSDGGELMIETSYEEGFISISIQDNGIGIPDEVKDKIFEPFFTTKDVGEGTGLGMSIAYKTIERHQGRFVVDSKLGEGTCFTIVIPQNQTIYLEEISND